MRCTFCATGKGGFARNLQAHEIIDQVLTVAEAFGQRPTNVGESPLQVHTLSCVELEARGGGKCMWGEGGLHAIARCSLWLRPSGSDPLTSVSGEMSVSGECHSLSESVRECRIIFP
jgi:hypothetical protein